MLQRQAGSAGGRRPGDLDVSSFIDSQPVGRFQVQVLLLCASVLFVDGFDTQAIGYVAPELIRTWNLPRAALGPLFSAGLFGLMLGALVLGPLADRVGRKCVIVLSTVAFGVCSLATAWADGSSSLLALRFLTGLGLGGAMPNAVALTAEFSPRRRRATMVMAMFCGFSLGAGLGGPISAALIPQFGWPSVFLVGGIAPLLLVPVLARSLPESACFLAISGRADDRVFQTMAMVAPSSQVAPGTHFTVHEPPLPGLPVRHLFRDGRAGATVLLWVVFFMSLLDLFFLSNWLPTVLSDLGASVSLAAVIGAMLQAGGVVGILALGSVIDRFSFRALAVTYLLAAVAVAAIGFATHSTALAAVAIFCAGFCIVGGQVALNALAATSYPTAIRSSGVGWAFGMGRAGSIVGPLVGGALLALHWATRSLFLAAAVPALCAAAAALWLAVLAGRRRHSPSLT